MACGGSLSPPSHKGDPLLRVVWMLWSVTYPPWSHIRLSHLYLVKIAGYQNLQIPESTGMWPLPSHGRQSACSHVNSAPHLPFGCWSCIFYGHGTCCGVLRLSSLGHSSGLRAPEPRGHLHPSTLWPPPAKPLGVRWGPTAARVTLRTSRSHVTPSGRDRGGRPFRVWRACPAVGSSAWPSEESDREVKTFRIKVLVLAEGEL